MKWIKNSEAIEKLKKKKLEGVERSHVNFKENTISRTWELKGYKGAWQKNATNQSKDTTIG